ncbi:MAG: enoyl-CoA hydratase [Nocardioides sp.]|nr:enoyl-CoA hydratase [Nocardioides sp.]
MVAGTETAAVPAEFRAAVAGMRLARLRPEVFCEEMPAPQRIAPYASALSADVAVDGTDVGTGRLILLHDPEGNDTWNGTFRCVAYCRSEIELDLVSDPLLAQVGWTWLVDALSAHGAVYTAVSGTVTRVATESFGGMAEDGGTAQVEVRASWTPLPTEAGTLRDGRPVAPTTALDITPHVEAWGELLCTAAGLEPVPEGVAVMPSRRGQRGPAASG